MIQRGEAQGVTRRVLITGTAGFIGFHLARLLLDEGFRVHGYDGMTDYSDVALKRRRHAMLLQTPGFTAPEAMLEDQAAFDADATSSSISPRRPGCATAWKTRAPISMPT